MYVTYPFVLANAGDAVTLLASVVLLLSTTSPLVGKLKLNAVTFVSLASMPLQFSLSANALSTGITKVTANITVYGTTKTYNFSKDGYIVVAPKATDKDFQLTSVPDTEAYINGLKSTGNFSANLKLQAAEDILAGEVNASKLSYLLSYILPIW